MSIANIRSDHPLLVWDFARKSFAIECSSMGFTARMGYPRSVKVESAKTGRVVEFIPIDDKDAAEYLTYGPTEECGVTDMVVYND